MNKPKFIVLYVRTAVVTILPLAISKSLKFVQRNKIYNGMILAVILYIVT